MFENLQDKSFITFEEFNKKYNKKEDISFKYFLTVYNTESFYEAYLKDLKKFKKYYDEKSYNKLLKIKETDVKIVFIPVYNSILKSKTFDYTYQEKTIRDKKQEFILRSTRKKFEARAEGYDDKYKVGENIISQEKYDLNDFYLKNALILNDCDFKKSYENALAKLSDLQNKEAAKLDLLDVKVTERHPNETKELFLVPFYMLKSKDDKIYFMNAVNGSKDDVEIEDSFLKEDIKKEKDDFLNEVKGNINFLDSKNRKYFNLLYVINMLFLACGVIGFSLYFFIAKDFNGLKMALTYILLSVSIVAYILVNIYPDNYHHIPAKINMMISNGIDYKSYNKSEIFMIINKKYKGFLLRALATILFAALMILIALIIVLFV